MAWMTCKVKTEYGGKPLAPGDQFEVRDVDVRVLVALDRASLMVDPPEPAPVPVNPRRAAADAARRAEQAADATAALREQYETLYGKRPFMGWGADVLREKIAAFVPEPPPAAESEAAPGDDTTADEPAAEVEPDVEGED